MINNDILWEILKFSDIETIMKIYKINYSFYDYCKRYNAQFIRIIFYQAGYVNLLKYSDDSLKSVIKSIGIDNLSSSLKTDYETVKKTSLLVRTLLYRNIIEFNCSNCRLYNLPHMPNLRVLNCSYNKLTYIHNYPKLEVLICDNNLIYLIILRNNNLRKLSCSSNFLKKLPQLDKCEYLDCSVNNIKRLPHLPKIKYLNCSTNDLQCITEKNISNEIEHINLSNNVYLREIPEDIINKYKSGLITLKYNNIKTNIFKK